jgi:hypothetical protein
MASRNRKGRWCRARQCATVCPIKGDWASEAVKNSDSDIDVFQKDPNHSGAYPPCYMFSLTCPEGRSWPESWKNLKQHLLIVGLPPVNWKCGRSLQGQRCSFFIRTGPTFCCALWVRDRAKTMVGVGLRLPLLRAWIRLGAANLSCAPPQWYLMSSRWQ